MTEQTTITPPPPVKAPDPILAELWEIKRQLNAEAGYDVDVLARMAHDAAKKIDIDHSNISRRSL